MSNMSRAAQRLMFKNNSDEINPHSGWSQSGNLVCQGPLVPAFAGQPPGSNAVRLQVCFPRCDVYTVQFEVTQTSQVSGGLSPTQQIGQLVFADITWKVHGATVRRSMTVISGSTI